jgi:chemotaxis signal transduction protein
MNNEAIDNAQHYFGDASSQQPARKLQLVRAGSSHFGVFADEIATIVPWREPTSLPNAPKSVRGVVSVQGRMLTVLDLASLPIEEIATSEAEAAGNVLPAHLIALRGDEQLALAVNEVGEMIEVVAGDFSGQRETGSAFLLGVLQRGDGEIRILNLKELFPAAIQGRERRRRRF